MYGTLLELQGGATLQRSEYAEARKWWEPESPQEEALDDVEATKKMMRTPDTYAYFVATLTPWQQFSASLSGNYTGSMLVPHEAGFGIPGQDSFSEVNTTKVSPTFFELNARLAYDFQVYNDVTLQLNGGEEYLQRDQMTLIPAPDVLTRTSTDRARPALLRGLKLTL